MANTSLYAALAGLPDEQQYYAQDPWYSAGSKTLGMRIDPNIYTNNRDALLYPILQGLAGGAMQGYGEGSALQQALQDASPIYQRITGQEYNPDTAFGPVASGDTYASMLAAGHIQPSIKQIKGDLLAAVLADENKQEIDREIAKIDRERKNKEDFETFKFNLETSPEEMQRKANQKAMDAEAETRGRLKAEGQEGDASSEKDPIMKDILTKIPKALQNNAIEEKGTLDKLNEGFKRVEQLMKTGNKVAKEESSSLPTSMFGVPLPASESKITRDTVAAGLVSVALSVWKGPLDEKDAARIIDPYVPSYWDNAATIKEKENGLKQLLLQNAKATPTLEGFGIAIRPSTLDKGGSKIPEGAQPTNRTSGGKPVYQLPNGQLWVP